MQDILTIVIVAVCLLLAVYALLRRLLGRKGGCSCGSCGGCSCHDACDDPYRRARDGRGRHDRPCC